MKKQTPATLGQITGHWFQAMYSAGLPERSAFITQQLSSIRSIFKELFSDEDLRTLLRAESMTAVPASLRLSVEVAGTNALENRSRRRR